MLESNHTVFMLHVNLLLQLSLLPHLCLLLQVNQSPQANPSESLAWSSINLHPQIAPGSTCTYAPRNIEINEHDAKVPLQDLLDHTTISIIEQEKDIITEAVQGKQENEKLSCTLICNWGFDGTSGHSEYKQKFSPPDISDQSIFCTTLVPLQMKSDNDTILWQTLYHIL